MTLDTLDSLLIITPDGHLKIPHWWPGQNPQPEVGSKCLGDSREMTYR